MSILTASNVQKRFSGNIVLKDVSLQIVPNKINLLIGSNGSGKSTLINVISGLLQADGGKISFMNHDITNKSTDEIFNKGIVRTFQTPRLFHGLSVLENLMMANHSIGESFRLALLSKRWREAESETRSKALSILEDLNMTDLKHNLAYDLSGGQIKLLELGKALMSDSKMILLDEPIAGINPTLAHEIFTKISQICQDTKTTFLIVEHRLDIALQYAEYVFVMGDGKIIAQDTPDKILQNDLVIKSYLG